MKLKDQQEKSW